MTLLHDHDRADLEDGVRTMLHRLAAGATERQRIETVTAQTTCQGCHGIINPFGFMQENYDAIGRWRTTDDGAPIDASITVSFLDEGPLSTSSPVEALRAFTRAARFQQCFARQVFRYYLGRDEGAGDDAVIRAEMRVRRTLTRLHAHRLRDLLV